MPSMVHQRIARLCRNAGAAALLACVMAGCLMDGALEPNGSGTLTIKLRMTNPAQLGPSKKQMQSNFVKLLSAEGDADKWATYRLQFDDVTKLSTIKFFSH